MHIRGFIVAITLATVNLLTYGQQGLPGLSLEEYIEYLVSMGYSEFEASDFSQEISLLEDNPVDINNCSEYDLSRLFFLTPFQLESIKNHISQNGPIRSLFELVYIPGFDKELAMLTSQFIEISDIRSATYKRKNTQFTTSLVYSDRDTVNYIGSGLKMSSRILHQSGLLAIGLITEKDKGERFYTESNKPEYLAGYVQFISPRSRARVIIGDYRVRFGQGLNVWQGYSRGSSPLNPNLMRGSSRIVPYASSDENNFFRGVALSMNMKKAKLNVYLSSNMIDANIKVLSDSSTVVSSFYDTGIHNNESSIAKRDVLTENSAGININHTSHRVSLGGSITSSFFSKYIRPQESVESIYDFNGKNNIVMSVDHALSLNKIYLYGETSVSSLGKIAFLEGARIYPVDRLRLNLLFGHTSLAYNSFHGHIFGKETINNFRSSILANIELELVPDLTLFAGAISHSGLWYGYHSASFPKSTQYMAEIIWNPSTGTRLKVSHRFKRSLADLSVERGIEKSKSVEISSSRMHLEIIPISCLRLSSRFELSVAPSGEERGFLLYHGIRFQDPRYPFTLIARYYAYNTDSYSTRIYAWEDDLLLHQSVPSLYGKGSRNYYILDYHPKNKLSLRFKYLSCRFEYENNETKYNEYRLQIRFRLSY